MGREAEQDPLEPGGVGGVLLERGLPADRLRLLPRPEHPATMAVGAPLEGLRVRPEELLELGDRPGLDLPDFGEAKRLEAARSSRPDARKGPKRQSRDEALLPALPHLHQPPRLGRVGRELGHHAVRPDPDAAVEPRHLPHAVPKPFRHREEGHRVQPVGPGKIEVALVERRHHHERRELLQHQAHGTGGAPVVVERGPDEHGAGAAARRLGRRHPRPHAEGPCAVRRRLYHPAPLRVAPDDEEVHRAQLWTEPAADLHEEGVEVDVQEARGHLVRGGSPRPRWRP